MLARCLCCAWCGRGLALLAAGAFWQLLGAKLAVLEANPSESKHMMLMGSWLYHVCTTNVSMLRQSVTIKLPG